MLVVEEKVFGAVIGNVDIVPTVVVEVRGSYSHGAADTCADA